MTNQLTNHKAKFISIITLILAGLITLYFWFAAEPESALDENVVATISNRTITVDELQEQMLKRSAGATQHFASAENKKALLKEMIQREIQITRALELGYEQRPEFIKAFENLLVTNLREDKLKKELALIEVTDAEIEHYYKSNNKKYSSPAKSRVAMIYFSVAKNARPETQAAVKAKAQEALKLAQTLPKTIRGFGSLAASYSEDQASRYMAGDIGWLVQGRESHFYKDPIVAETAASLSEINQLSSLVQGDEGFYLLKLLDRKESKVEPIAKVGSSIKRILFEEKYEQAEQDWLQSLEDELQPVLINQAVLQSVQPPAATQPERQNNTPPDLPKS